MKVFETVRWKSKRTTTNRQVTLTWTLLNKTQTPTHRNINNNLTCTLDLYSNGDKLMMMMLMKKMMLSFDYDLLEHSPPSPPDSLTYRDSCPYNNILYPMHQ